MIFKFFDDIIGPPTWLEFYIAMKHLGGGYANLPNCFWTNLSFATTIFCDKNFVQDQKILWLKNILYDTI